MRHSYCYTLVLLTWGFLNVGHAQHVPGLAMGNYSGTHALYHNPAFVSDSRYSVYLNVIGTQFYTANNHIRYDAPFSFISFITNSVSDQYRTDQGKINFPRVYLDQKINGNIKRLNAGGDFRLPSLQLNLKRGKYGIAATSRVRYALNVSNTSEGFARLITGTTKDNAIQGQSFVDQSGTLHGNALGELALTFGGVVLDNDIDFLKVGVTVKRLIGLYNAHLQVDHANFEVQPDPNLNNARQRVILREMAGSYGYTSDAAFENFKPNGAWLFGGTPAGSGWGFDLGAVYEYRPDIQKYTYSRKGIEARDASKNKYLYRISASLTDIGKVRFKNPNYIRTFEGTSNRGILTYDTFLNLEGTSGLFGAMNRDLRLSAEGSSPFTSLLPMAAQLSIDYNIKPKVYVNALLVQNLRPRRVFGMKQESVLAITPRYETRWYEISAPVSLMNGYGSLGVGLAGRIGPLWFGTDHITGLLNIGKPKAVTLFFGISTGLFRQPPDIENKCWPPRGSWLRRVFTRDN